MSRTARTPRPARRPHVELRRVSKRFGGVQALADVSLTIYEGEIHSLVGENGAGKSTLGKLIAGVTSPDEGDLQVDGRDVAFGSPRDALLAGITIIEQELALVPQLTVLENVFLGIEPHRTGLIRRGSLRRRYQELVRSTGLDLPPSVPVGALRLAERQKAEILRALARGARLIVMDEPTAALDRRESQQLFEIMRSLRAAGTTVVYVSHFLDEVLALADRVTVLKDGRIVRTADAASESKDSLITAMLGTPVDVAFPPRRPVEADSPIVVTVDRLSRAGAVREASLELRRGEIVGLAGLVGSGRSELARLIFGADRPTGGTVSIAGRRLRPGSTRHAIARGIAMLPESRKDQGLVMGRSVAENVTLASLGQVSRAGLVRPGVERDRCRAIMAQLRIRAPSPKSPVSALSGGNQQKVLFGRWLSWRPLLLIADEPTRGVDVGAKRAIYDHLQAVAAAGTAVLLISSEAEEVVGLANRVLVMRAGAIVAEFAGAETSVDEVMRAALGAGEAAA